MKSRTGKRKHFHMHSTFHHEPNLDERTQKPKMVLDYNQMKSGIDDNDAFLQHYVYWFRTRRWPMRVFTYLVFLCCLNAMVLYKRAHPEVDNRSPRFRYEFMYNCCHQLMSAIQEERSHSKHFIAAEFFRITHLINELKEKHAGKRKINRQRCGICKRRVKEDQLISCDECSKKKLCSKCVVKLTLCNDCNKLQERKRKKVEQPVHEQRVTRSTRHQHSEYGHCKVSENGKLCGTTCTRFCFHCQQAYCVSHQSKYNAEYCQTCQNLF